MQSLDLHGVRHRDAEELVDSFIGRYFNILPIEIITGNSVDMQNILKEIINGLYYQLYSLYLDFHLHQLLCFLFGLYCLSFSFPQVDNTYCHYFLLQA